MTNEDGLLSVSMRRDGDRFAELGYTEADTSVHDIALLVASFIAQGKRVSDELFERRGIGPTEWALKYGDIAKKLSCSLTSGSNDGGGTMKDLYDAISSGNGEDAYLGDGLWVKSRGGTYER